MLDKPVLIIDTLNMFMKFYHVNKDSGVYDPGIYGSIYFLYLVLRNKEKYGKIYLVLEGKNKNKYELYPQYKEGRESKHEALKNFDDFLKLISKFNINIVENKFRECDETIAYLALNHRHKSPVIVYSNDKDFIQLAAFKNIFISEKFEKGEFKILSQEEMYVKFKNNKDEHYNKFMSENLSTLILYRTFKGDKSDNINSIKLLTKDIKEIINVWEEDDLNDRILSNIILRLDDMKLKMKIAENFSEILRNFQLMNLGKCGSGIMFRKHTKNLKINVSGKEHSGLVRKYAVGEFFR